MNVLIACDKFKSSLRAVEVCQSIAKGLEQTNNNLDIKIHPMADGGDGTISVLQEHLDLQKISTQTVDPYLREITVDYGSNHQKAYIELATASGIARLKPDEYNPMLTTTIGTGTLIKHALENKLKHIVLGLGGSCTTDAGLGIAHALGFQFLNATGDRIIPMGASLHTITDIIFPETELPASFQILCDVDNPLYGPAGAAYIFGPQKGASEKDVIILDKGLQHIAQLINGITGKEIQSIKGGGAAGGIAAGLHGLLDATIISGFEYLNEVSQLEDKMAWADLLITGEGQLDMQSFGGKVVGQMLRLSRKYKLPTIAVVGHSLIEIQDAPSDYLVQIKQISELALDMKDSMEQAAQYLFRIGSEIVLDDIQHH